MNKPIVIFKVPASTATLEVIKQYVVTLKELYPDIYPIVIPNNWSVYDPTFVRQTGDKLNLSVEKSKSSKAQKDP